MFEYLEVAAQPRVERNGLRHGVSGAKNQVWCLAKDVSGENPPSADYLVRAHHGKSSIEQKWLRTI